MGGDDEKKEEVNRIMCFLRIRPAKKGEIDPANGSNYLCEVQPDDKTVILSEGGKQYTYDWVYDGDKVSQEDIFMRVGKPVIDNVFKGFWGSIMCYGQTGTGKSFTMCNFDRRNEGLIPRSMRMMFEKIEQERDRIYTINFSFIQIYCDRLQDLFNPMSKDELKLTRDKDGVAFPGITERTINSEAEFRTAYEDGHQHRVITATKMNPESSRGHAALFIQIKSVPRDDPSGENRNGKLFLIDLAGYERFSKTGVQEGKMKEEAKTINASLLSLGNCVGALSERSDHVPWRDAKLTRMLEDAIGGKAKCSIILCAGPSSEHFHETMGTLYFGSRAMSVKTDAKLAVNIDYKKLAAKLQMMLNDADTKLKALEVEATRRQLEREQTEARMQSEWAGLKKRQEDQLKGLLTTGATPQQIQDLITANQAETELLEEQHYQIRGSMEERHEEAIKEEQAQRAALMAEDAERVSTSNSADMNKLQRELQHTKQELEKYKQLAKDAESEARRLNAELTDAKIEMAKAGVDWTPAASSSVDDLPSPSGAKPAGGSGSGSGSSSSNALTSQQSLSQLSGPEAKRVMEQRIASVKAMLEEAHAAKLAESLDPLQEELGRYKALYDDLNAGFNEQLQVQKDTLTQMYEEELAQLRESANDVQEKLKKNHMTIKRSYQKQKEELQEENEQLMAQVAQLTERLNSSGGAGGAGAGAGAAAAASKGAAGAALQPSSPVGGKAPSLAELMISKKASDRKIDELKTMVSDLKAEIDYVQTEKAAVERQLSEYQPKASEERMKPAAVRKLREDFDKLKEAKENVEKELFKMRAQQALSGPQGLSGGAAGAVAAGSIDDLAPASSNAQAMEGKEDMCGDFEGTKVFVDKMLKFPYFAGAQKVANTHEAVLGSLTTDLDEFRRILRLRFYFLGQPGTGKTALLKCLTAASAPLIRSCPDTIPTLHPLPQTFCVDDATTSKLDMHRRYVKFDADDEAEQQQRSGVFSSMVSGMAGLVGLGDKGQVSDPAKIYIETLDFPGNQAFFRGFPPYLLPSKNAMYIVAYNLTQPVSVIQEDVGIQLRNIHAAVHRDYHPMQGGDGPRVAVVLMGTHRDAMRDSRDASVLAYLNKITIALGQEFYKLRGEKAYGLQVVGNFACSTRDWTVLSGKQGAPANFRDLCSYLATFAQKLYDNTPSSFLPTSRATAAFSSYMMGDDNIALQAEKTGAMDPLEKRMRKGIVTFLTALYREQKVRWLLGDKELRSLICEHLEIDENTGTGNTVVNFMVRELRARSILTVMPSHIYEPKYLPGPGQSSEALPRDGLVCLDTARLLNFYSVFIGGHWIPKIPLAAYKDIISRDIKENKIQPMFDLIAMKDKSATLSSGVLTQECAAVLLNRFIPMVGSDPRLLFEFLCVMGLGTGLRSENAMLAPCHFTKSMPSLLTGYISYLVSNYGDGIGRKYLLTAAPESFFCRLQTVLVPFGNAPQKEPEYLNMNFRDGALLILEKSRLKWGTYGSKVLKDAIVNISIPVRGILKLEGNNLYVACTGRSANSAQAVAAVRTLMDGIHHHIQALCRREFRGVTATFQEMRLEGVEMKRERLGDGIKSYIESMGGAAQEVAQQAALISGMTDPAGKEIETALKALPTWMFAE